VQVVITGYCLSRVSVVFKVLLGFNNFIYYVILLLLSIFTFFKRLSFLTLTYKIYLPLLTIQFLHPYVIIN